MRLATILLLVTVPSSIFAIDSDRLGQEDDIREAVFRHRFDHNASGQQKTAHAYCLSIMVGEKDSDPLEQFMKRFAHHKPPVRKWSACHWTSIQVVENRFGRAALIFSVAQVNWISDTEVTMGGRYEEGNVSSSGNTYTVKKQNGRWTVTNDQMAIISENREVVLPGANSRAIPTIW
jgi:hypothetical protein